MDTDSRQYVCIGAALPITYDPSTHAGIVIFYCNEQYDRDAIKAEIEIFLREEYAAVQTGMYLQDREVGKEIMKQVIVRVEYYSVLP